MQRVFELSKEQHEKAQLWMKEREKYSGAIGGQFSFIFIPTSLGMIAKVTDGKETLDLTDYSDW
jgi:hypothetical protein